MTEPSYVPEPGPRPASSPGVGAFRTGSVATLLLLLMEYRGVPAALWVLGIPSDAPIAQGAGEWLAPILAGFVLGVAKWVGGNLRDYVHDAPGANVVVRVLARVLP